MYTTETDNVIWTVQCYIIDAHTELFGNEVFTVITSLIFAGLATLDPSYPAATSILVGKFAPCARIRQAFWFGDHYIRNYISFPFLAKPYGSIFLSKEASLNGACFHTCC